MAVAHLPRRRDDHGQRDLAAFGPAPSRRAPVLPVVISYTCESGFDLSYTDNQSTASAVLWRRCDHYWRGAKAIGVKGIGALATDAAHAHRRGDVRGGG